jgi:hypothetical protein
MTGSSLFQARTFLAGPICLAVSPVAGNTSKASAEESKIKVYSHEIIISSSHVIC